MQQAHLCLGSILTLTWWPQSKTLSICCDLRSRGPSLSTRQQCLGTTKQGRPVKKSPRELIAKKILDTFEQQQVFFFLIYQHELTLQDRWPVKN